jgi:hypothetical protein
MIRRSIAFFLFLASTVYAQGPTATGTSTVTPTPTEEIRQQAPVVDVWLQGIVIRFRGYQAEPGKSIDPDGAGIATFIQSNGLAREEGFSLARTGPMNPPVQKLFGSLPVVTLEQMLGDLPDLTNTQCRTLLGLTATQYNALGALAGYRQCLAAQQPALAARSVLLLYMQRLGQTGSSVPGMPVLEYVVSLIRDRAERNAFPGGTPTPVPTATSTPTQTSTSTPTVTLTATASETATAQPTATETQTETSTATATETTTPTATMTETPTP